MENTIENKAKFFALYWGQNVLMSAVSDGTVRTKVLGEYFEGELRGAFLELKPLSLISDEDAIEIAKIENDFTDPIKRGKSLIGIIERDFVRFKPSIIIKIIDYLRSKGYALEWMDKTIKEQISCGWIKLKEGIE